MDDPTKNPMVPVALMLPPAGRKVIIVCKEFRCAGHLDEKGVWRDDAHNDELGDVIGWLEVEANR